MSHHITFFYILFYPPSVTPVVAVFSNLPPMSVWPSFEAYLGIGCVADL